MPFEMSQSLLGTNTSGFGILSPMGPSGEGREPQDGADQVRALPMSPTSSGLSPLRPSQNCHPLPPPPKEPGPAEMRPAHFLPGLPLCPWPSPYVHVAASVCKIKISNKMQTCKTAHAIPAQRLPASIHDSHDALLGPACPHPISTTDHSPLMSL